MDAEAAGVLASLDKLIQSGVINGKDTIADIRNKIAKGKGDALGELNQGPNTPSRYSDVRESSGDSDGGSQLHEGAGGITEGQSIQGKTQELFQSQPEQARVTSNWYYSQLASSSSTCTRLYP